TAATRVTYFNPLTGSILQSTQVQRTQSADKDRQSRQQSQQPPKNAASREDEFAPTVESVDALAQIGDDQPRQQQQRKSLRPQGEIDDENLPPHLDLMA